MMFVRGVGTVGSRLVEHSAGLQFDVLAVLVGQQVFPDTSFTGLSPQEDFHTQFLIKIGMMDGSEIFSVPVDAVIVIVISQNVVRLGIAEIIGVIPSDVPVVFIYRERGNLTPVSDEMVARITELGFLADPVSGIHPLVIRLINIGLVVPGGVGCEVSFVLRQIDFHSPGRACQPFVGEQVAAYTAVIFLSDQIIHRSAGGGSVSDDTEIELDTAGGPGTSHGDITEFGYSVLVDEVFTGGLVHGSPYLSAYFRKEGNFDVIILQFNCFPFPVFTFGCKSVKPEVGVEQVGRSCYRIRIREFIGFQGLRLFLNGYMLGKSLRSQAEDTGCQG